MLAHSLAHRSIHELYTHLIFEESIDHWFRSLCSTVVDYEKTRQVPESKPVPKSEARMRFVGVVPRYSLEISWLQNHHSQANGITRFDPEILDLGSRRDSRNLNFPLSMLTRSTSLG